MFVLSDELYCFSQRVFQVETVMTPWAPVMWLYKPLWGAKRYSAPVSVQSRHIVIFVPLCITTKILNIRFISQFSATAHHFVDFVVGSGRVYMWVSRDHLYRAGLCTGRIHPATPHTFAALPHIV